ncbi:hypothetical protein SDC9_54646 [bioreactor metagenome]|uniref:Uncharacterized protein n=1 Tax=bioreactor metagenome TaxID=1076179 RepID=A0A644X2E9_9ZZZZ
MRKLGGEQAEKCDNNTNCNGNRINSEPSAGFKLADNRGNAAAHQNACLHGVRDDVDDLGTQTGNAEEDENSRNFQLQRNQRLRPLDSYLILG